MRGVEVVAVLGDSVVHTKDCVATSPTGRRWLVAASVISFLVAALAFDASLANAADNAAALLDHVAHERPAYSFRPAPRSVAIDVAMFAGPGVGLAFAIAALLRSRREHASYRVGTAPDVDLALATTSRTAFPLVARVGDEYVFMIDENFIDDLSISGTTLTLDALARPSTLVAGAIEILIPPHAQIRARVGAVTFFATAFDAPKPPSVRRAFVIDSDTVACIIGSLALHLFAVGLTKTVPMERSREWTLRPVFSPDVRIDGMNDDEALPPEEVGDGNDGYDPFPRTSFACHGPYEEARRFERVPVVDPQIARTQAIEAARTAGLLGSTSLHDSIAMLSSSTVYSSGLYGDVIYGPLAAYGEDSFGMRRRGVEPGGGGTGWGTTCGEPEPSCRFGTLGHGRGTGEGYGLSRSGGPFVRGHHPSVPAVVEHGRPTRSEGIDSQTLRRYFRRNTDALMACYEKHLLVHPTMAGAIAAQFIITADGTVQTVQVTSNGVIAGIDEVAVCVSDVVKSIKFPATTHGGATQVSYPLVFRVTGR